MSFFDLGNGTSALSNAPTSVEVGTTLAVIPKNTNLRCVVEDIAWDRVPDFADNNPGVDYISVRYSVIAPKEHHGRKLFQKLWVSAQGNPSKNDPQGARVKGLQFLAVINVNTPEQPLNQCQAAPTDIELGRLRSAVLMVKVGVIKGNDNVERNFVAAVSGSTSQPATAPARKPAPVAQPQQQQAPVAPQPAQQEAPFPEADGGSVDGDEIPF